MSPSNAQSVQNAFLIKLVGTLLAILQVIIMTLSGFVLKSSLDSGNRLTAIETTMAAHTKQLDKLWDIRDNNYKYQSSIIQPTDQIP